MRSILLILAFFAVAVPSLASAADEPAVARTKALIAAFQKVKSDAPPEANKAAFGELDGFLDFDVLATAPLEPRKDKFTPAQRKEFQTKFRELIRLIAYPNSGGFFREAEVKFLAPKKAGDVTVVTLDTRLPKEDLETEVGLHWKGDKLVDVSFDGDSLVADYRNQFTRIVDKEGAAGLIAKATERLETLQKGKKE